MADRPTVLGVATYPDTGSAMADVQALWGIDREGFGHVAVAVLDKGLDGTLRLDRADTTAAHRAWGEALIAGALAVVAAPLAIEPLSNVATENATWAGVGGIVAYFWHNTPKGQLQRMSDLLESGQAALVVVALDHAASTIEDELRNATRAIVTETDGGDIELAFEEALAREHRPA